MDKWLKGNVVNPSVSCVTDKIDDLKTQNKKSSKTVRKFCAKWLEKEEFAKWLVHKIDASGKDFAYCNVCNSLKDMVHHPSILQILAKLISKRVLVKFSRCHLNPKTQGLQKLK